MEVGRHLARRLTTHPHSHRPSCRPATMYCGVYGVYGYNAASYTISASYSAAIILTAGETWTAESSVASSQLYSMVYPPSTQLVTLSVVSDLGTTAVYVGPYGPPPTATSAFLASGQATTQLLADVRHKSVWLRTTHWPCRARGRSCVRCK